MGFDQFYGARDTPATMCNRPDRQETWYSDPGTYMVWGKGASFTTWCDGAVSRDLASWCAKNGDWRAPWVIPALNRKGVTGDANFEQVGWPKMHCGGTGAIGVCTMKTPKEQNKYACCTNGKTSSLQCGNHWCKEDTSNCDTFMGAYCSAGTRLIDDANCYSKYQISKITEINQMCSQPENLMKPLCKDFCNNQVDNDGAYSGTCKATASRYCGIDANKTKPECACITYKDDPTYKELMTKYGDSLKTTNHQCWVPACVGNDIWSNTMTSYTGTCPGTIQICAQSLNVSSLTAQNIGKIGSECKLDSTQGSTTIINQASPSSSPQSSSPPRTPPPSSSPPPGSSTPPGVSVSPSPSPPPSSGEPLSPGAIVAIVIGAVVVLILILKGARVI